MKDLSSDNLAGVFKAFNSTSRYLDDLLNIDHPYFEGMVNQIYPPELQLNKANTSDTEAPFLDLHMSISNGFVSSKINYCSSSCSLLFYYFFANAEVDCYGNRNGQNTLIYTLELMRRLVLYMIG